MTLALRVGDDRAGGPTGIPGASLAEAASTVRTSTGHGPTGPSGPRSRPSRIQVYREPSARPRS